MTWKFQNQPLVSIFAFVGCGGGEDANTDEPKGSAKTETTYGIGDTWEVEGQWKLTIDGVTITDERNEYADEEPAQVVIIDYSYENIGYEDEDGIMDGLYFAIDNEHKRSKKGRRPITGRNVKTV